MAEKELKWYGILAILFGTVISFADPIIFLHWWNSTAQITRRGSV